MEKRMITLRRRIAAVPKLRLALVLVLVVLGFGLIWHFGTRSYRSFRELNYIHAEGLDRGTASLDAIRPWMTIRFVAVAYAVPEEYLYAKLNIPFDRRNANKPLGPINDDNKLGQSPHGPYPAIIDKVRDAITAYRANPVATGLRDVRPWMSVRYIANSTGVPEQTIFREINIPASGNESKPLDLLSKEQHYPGGPPALVDAIKNVLAQHKASS
jgi:hypothetical protein